MSYYFNPIAGRMGRLGWWLSQLLVLVILVVGFVLIIRMHPNVDPDNLMADRAFLLKVVILAALTTYINLCACLNRLRDSGRPGWVYFAHFIPYIGAFVIIYFCGIEKGSPQISTSIFSDPDSSRNADDVIQRYQSGQGSASRYEPPAGEVARPAMTRPSGPSGFGRRSGFVRNYEG